MEVDGVITTTVSFTGFSERPQSLPRVIISLIVSEVIKISPLLGCLKLRLVCHQFDTEVLRELFNRFQINNKIRTTNVFKDGLYSHRRVVRRYWDAFVHCETPALSFLNGKTQLTTAPIEDEKLEVTKYQFEQFNNIHNVLNEAADTLLVMMTGRNANRYSSNTFNNTQSTGNYCRGICIHQLSKAAVNLLGVRSAWRYIHPQSRYTHIWTLGDSCKEPFYHQTLHLKSAKFWVILTTAYCGSIENLQTLFDIIKTEDQYCPKQPGQSSFSYRERVVNISESEREWVDAVVTCLIIAVNRNDPKLATFLLEQDLLTTLWSFTTADIETRSLLESAVQKQAVDVLKLLLERDCLAESDDEASKLPQYTEALWRAVESPQYSPHRDTMVKQLLKSTGLWQTPRCMQILLIQVARQDDLPLAEMMLSLISKNRPIPTHDVDSETVKDPEKHPLLIAVRERHILAAEFLLKHSDTLNLKSMASWTPPIHDFRTSATLELLRRHHTTPQHEFLSILSAATSDFRIEQIRALLVDHQSKRLLRNFFRYYDVNTKASPTDSLTLGQHALCAAIASLCTWSTQYLIQTLRVTFTSTTALPSFADMGGDVRLYMRSRLYYQGRMHELLLQHGMHVNADRTAVHIHAVCDC